MDRTISTLAGFAANFQFSDIRPEAVHAAKRCLIDALGCSIGAFSEEPVAALRRLASRVQSEQPATLFGTRTKTSPDLAALVNGSMIRYSDFSDDYFGTETSPARGDVGPHPSDNIGGIVAAAESAGVDGRTLLLGIVLGYEICGQFVDTVVLKSNGWDYPPLHAVSTALAGGRLLGLTESQLAHAVRLAIVPNISLYETRVGELSQWKGIAGPNGSRNGLFAAQMAAEGITGPANAFEGSKGFIKQLKTPFELGPFGGPARTLRIEDTYFKSLPIRYELQTPVELALKLHGSFKAAETAAIKVFIDGRSMFTRDEDPSLWDPRTRETADHSGPYLIGAALVDGVISHATFTEQRFRNPEILSVVDRIEMIPDPDLEALFPWTMACRIELVSFDGGGRVFEYENPRGHPQNAMTDQEILDKFHSQAGRLSKERREGVVDWVFSIEKKDDINQLFELMLQD
ncbi:MAG: 2-methylcitrate dehydratase [Mucilaginibacter sp.]|nr:2-methylcitrate dehydratase [Mucilaginibacter sp.]